MIFEYIVRINKFRWLLVIPLFLSISTVYPEEEVVPQEVEEQQDNIGVTHNKGHNSEKKSHSRIDYGKYLEKIRNICSAMELDGRRTQFLSTLEKSINKDDPCTSCSALLKTFLKGCKIKVKKEKNKDKTGMGNVKVINVQREPSTTTVDYISRAFLEIFEPTDLEYRGETSLAVSSLLSVLKEAGSSSPGGSEYFSVVTEYIKATVPDTNTEKSVTKKKELKEEPKELPDSAFDF